MTHMFDHYPQPEEYIPTNRRIRIPVNEATIMPGETTVHSFDIPFDVDEVVADFKVIYKLGVEVILEKGKDEADIQKGCGGHFSILSWTLTPAESMLFKDTLLQAQAQIKFIMKDGTTAYTEICKIKLEDALDVHKSSSEDEEGTHAD